MPLQSAQIFSVNQTHSNKVNKSEIIGVVYDVVLDSTNQIIRDRNLDSTAYIGSILFLTPGVSVDNVSDIPIALPFDKNYKTLPVKNESVSITITNGKYYYRRFIPEHNANVDFEPNIISTQYSKKKSSVLDNTTGDYESVIRTGIINKKNTDSLKYDGYGLYFTANSDIHRLKLYEGDTLIESRYGQSIRFSGYNNFDKKFSPSIIIRNGESAASLKSDINTSIDEDINNDGSIIAMTSSVTKSTFLTDILRDSSVFKKPLQNLKGANQLLLNSDRIIISAKTSEMMFFSKGDYGFRSEGNLLIHNSGGMNVTVGADSKIVTNDRDIDIITGNGHINLGAVHNDTSLEPMVKGDILVSILTELIEAISNMKFKTPSGPTAVGPENKSDFNDIKSRLKEILSRLNKTV